MAVAGLSFLGKVGYSSGNAGKSTLWSTLDFFFLFFLTELWGLPPQQAGLVIFLSLVWDGVSDPILGYLVDRTRSPLGRYGPYLIAGAPLSALSFVLLFHDSGQRGDALFWTVLLTSLLFRTCYTVCDVPHNALMARVAAGPRDASVVSGLRFFFSSVGALGSGLAIGWALKDGPDEAGARQLYMLTMAAGGVYVATIWLAWASSRKVDTASRCDVAHMPVAEAFAMTLSNPALRALLATAFIQAATLPAFAKGVAYFATYVRDDAAWSGNALMILTFAQAVSQPFWIWITLRVTKGLALSMAYGCCAVALALFAALGAHPGLAWLWIGMLGVGIGGATMLLWAMLPDVIDAGEARTGKRLEALPTALFLLVLKSGAGASAALTGAGLAMIGLRDAEPGDSVFGDSLTLLMVLIPLCGVVLAQIIRWGMLRTGSAGGLRSAEGAGV